MADVKKMDQGMTVVEATEKLEEFKQKLVDENYEELMQEGETTRKVDFETLEALEVILYYIQTIQEDLGEQDL